MPTNTTRIVSRDFDGFVAEVTSQIWNRMINQPEFRSLQPAHFAELFESVNRVLSGYRTAKSNGTFSRYTS